MGLERRFYKTGELEKLHVKYLRILHFLHCRTSCSVISITTVRGSFSKQFFFSFFVATMLPAYIRLSGLAQLRTATRHSNDLDKIRTTNSRNGKLRKSK